MACGYVRQAIDKQCAKCGRAFVGASNRLYCSASCKERARPERKVYPRTDKQRMRDAASKRERRRAHGRGDRSTEYAKRRAPAEARRVERAHAKAVRQQAIQLRKLTTKLKRRLEKFKRRLIVELTKKRAQLRGISRGQSDYTISLKQSPEKYAKALTRWRARKLKKRSGLVMVDDGTFAMPDSRACLYCGTKLNQSNRAVDHMMPLALGGIHSACNAAPCCRMCNSKKGAMSFSNWVDTLSGKNKQRAIKFYERLNGPLVQIGLFTGPVSKKCQGSCENQANPRGSTTAVLANFSAPRPPAS